MSHSITDHMWKNFNKNPPAPMESINKFETKSGLSLPNNYVQFLQRSDGGEGFIGPNAYTILWRIEDLLNINSAYRVAEFVPGLLIFGSDGGGEAFGFDFRKEPNHIVTVPLIGMSWTTARDIAPDFDVFLQELSNT